MEQLDTTILTVQQEYPINYPLSRMAKRSFDFFFSLLAILLIFPIAFLIIGGLIKMTSGGPMLFSQRRTGRDGREFICYKFRTMRLNPCADLCQAVWRDERITRFGQFLRKSNLDEIPQFWNVLIGDMSVIGPRPHMLRHTEEYTNKMSNYMDRHGVKPGITGYAQVNGFRGGITTYDQLEGRVNRDLWYITHWSPLLDLKIIFWTIKNIFKGEENAY